MELDMTKPACVNIALVVSDEKIDDDGSFEMTAKEVEAILLKHGEWMTGFYPNEEHLVASYFTKVAQLKDPYDYKSDGGEKYISNTCFYIAEEFKTGDSIVRHMTEAKKNDYFQTFEQIIKKYGKVVAPIMQPGGRVLASRVDGLDPKPERQPTDTTLNIALVVPASEAAAVTAVLQKHFAWMQDEKVYGKDLNILQSAYGTFAPKMQDAFASPQVQAVHENGDPLFIFTINAEFAEWKEKFADEKPNEAFNELDENGSKKYPTASAYHLKKAGEHDKEFSNILYKYAVPKATIDDDDNFGGGNTIEFNIVGHLQPDSKIFHSIRQGK